MPKPCGFVPTTVVSRLVMAVSTVITAPDQKMSAKPVAVAPQAERPSRAGLKPSSAPR